jgi:uncharacterized membrane protein YfhO
MINTILKVCLAIMLLLCFLNMPYGYYELVRITSFVILGYLAIIEYKSKNFGHVPVYIIGTILFNPIVKIALGRDMWQVVDFVFAAILIVTTIVSSVFNKTKSVRNN